MKYFLLTATIALSMHCHGYCQAKKQVPGKKIIIKLDAGVRAHSDSAILSFRKAELVDPGTPQTRVKKAIIDGKTEWVLDTGEPIYIHIRDLPGIRKGQNAIAFLGEPGDNLTITIKGESLVFSGKGAVRFKLQYDLRQAYNSVQPPAFSASSIKSLEQFFEYNDYLDEQMRLMEPLLKKQKGLLSPYAYHLIGATMINQNIDRRSDVFSALFALIKQTGMPKKNILAIYDTVYYPATSQRFNYASLHIYANFKPVMYQVLRKYDFDFEHPAIKDELERKRMYLEAGLLHYKGLPREKFILDYFGEKFVREMVFSEVTRSFLAKYYNEKSYPEYKQFMRQFEQEARKLSAGLTAPDLTLRDTEDRPFSNKMIKGKLALIDFWFTGCTGCVQMTPAMHAVEQRFAGDTNIVFIRVSIDENRQQWLNSISKGKYTSTGGIHLYTEGKGVSHPVIDQYMVSGYPSLCIIDLQGRLNWSPPDPRKDTGRQLIQLIEKELAPLRDGPYVLYNNDSSATVYSINGRSLTENRYADPASLPLLEVQSNLANQLFPVSLKKKLSIEPTVFAQPEKLLALSDIEGNFDAFRKLLQANGVIDEQFNWTFGNGHLVFAGDMFDRGSQVTECLWLTYSLEEKAKVAGGYVHFILGNHEIMNMQGNHRYAIPKYTANAALIGKTLQQLYNENSELGRWLRTKNIIEKIGDLLFIHGGVSKQMNELPVSLIDINRIARGYYADNRPGYDSHQANTIMSTTTGLFWYRGYYKEKISTGIIDSTLQKFGVSHIVTGHTIVADTISLHYNGKIINTDTHHAGHNSEALLVETNRFYRVNEKGEKKPLLTEPVLRDNARKEP